jgi:hypothetical protein
MSWKYFRCCAHRAHCCHSFPLKGVSFNSAIFNFQEPPLLSAPSRLHLSYAGIPHVHWLTLVFFAFCGSSETLYTRVFWGRLFEPWPLLSPVGTLCLIPTNEYRTLLFEGFGVRMHKLACFAFQSSLPLHSSHAMSIRIASGSKQTKLYFHYLEACYTITHSPQHTPFLLRISKQTTDSNQNSLFPKSIAITR